MRLDILRTLTPLGWLAAVLVLASLVAWVGHGLGLRWDPFDLAQRRVDAAEARAEIARADAYARALEVEGAQAQASRLDRHTHETLAAERITAVAAADARSAHDASTPLDPDRADRLRDHDRRLCDLAPAVCHPAPADAAGGGEDAVPS